MVDVIGLTVMEKTRLEGLLGEPLIAADPLIDIKQAAAVLGLTRVVVRGMLDSGALPHRDAAAGQLATRMMRLADVLAWESSPSRITVEPVAALSSNRKAAVDYRDRAVGVVQNATGDRAEAQRAER
ncbi:helix-turn-helix domain-containing protein [Streptomyces sp. SID13031]|uniref:helix-turn-helix domain-containing protein n=1 Tax=Streptomyces sp. SID13031 TaxID=2706046 RepID=UPI0013C9BDEC|nr:helix-turn-helix domain-containing protein [Streptomyces sp. SID13031]NEA37604.1 helix-turn-helix domain-containing protein [Streptomyces sp. SID13031]